MHSEFRGSRTIFYFRFSWGPPFGFFQWIINKFQLKIQRGDPMIIWNQKLFQIHETRCVSTNGQLDITHKFSSKSHNGFPIGAGIILHRVKLNASFNVSFNKQLNLTTKIGMVGVLGIGNLPQKFGASISKFVDFFLMSNFCLWFFWFWSRQWLAKVMH